jgi:hypothetical protein
MQKLDSCQFGRLPEKEWEQMLALPLIIGVIKEIITPIEGSAHP